MPRLTPFRDELPIPDTVHPAHGIAGHHHLSIAARAEQVRLHRDLPLTEAWCYRLEHGRVAQQGRGSSYLGPTVEVQRGETVTVAWINGIPASHTLPFEVIKVPNPDVDTTLPVPENEPGRDGALGDAEDTLRQRLRGLRATLVTHLHGARVQADSDGWPDNTIVPGQAAHYHYANDQAASMLWYHDHSMHVTRLNVFAGLAGAWLVRDAEERSLDLPSGRHELPLVIQDRNLDLDGNGQFTGAMLHKTEVDTGPAEFFGPYTLVNGKIWPKASVEPLLYRLRVLNGANARTFRLILLDDQGNSVNDALWQIGTDQGLMQSKTPVAADGLLLASAERVDLLVDFSGFRGRSLYLWNTADAPFGDDAAKQPAAAEVTQELQALLADPLASADAVDPKNAFHRRLFPQVMRFDVAQQAAGHSCGVPPDPLWLKPHPRPVVEAGTTIRIMGLVERPPEVPAPDATSMLVFYEFVPVGTEPLPPGAEVVRFTYWRPGKGAMETGDFRKDAEGFYDPVGWHDVHLDSTELWYIVNLSGDTHPIHVHLVHFEVQHRFGFTWDGGTGVFHPDTDTLTHVEAPDERPIGAEMLGPKDTVRVNPGEMVGIAMTFAPYPGRYIYHCHILEHEDHDMMRPFVVVPPWVPHHEH
jgi:spore coat protein A